MLQREQETETGTNKTEKNYKNVQKKVPKTEQEREY